MKNFEQSAIVKAVKQLMIRLSMHEDSTEILTPSEEQRFLAYVNYNTGIPMNVLNTYTAYPEVLGEYLAKLNLDGTAPVVTLDVTGGDEEESEETGEEIEEAEEPFTDSTPPQAEQVAFIPGDTVLGAEGSDTMPGAESTPELLPEPEVKEEAPVETKEEDKPSEEPKEVKEEVKDEVKDESPVDAEDTVEGGEGQDTPPQE